MRKKTIFSIWEKNRIIDNIIEAMVSRNHFLLLGHENPDEDCISSMVAFSLLLGKLCKDVSICLGGPVQEHFQYLLNICTFNSIGLLKSCDVDWADYDTFIICDTPKQEMVVCNSSIWPGQEDNTRLHIEIDHHIGADSEYIGDEGYCLVTEATSSCELVGHLAFKLSHREDILSQYHIKNVFSRNIVLAILTGIISDSQMGKYLKSNREKRYYSIFSTLFNNLLARETVKETNFSNMEEVFSELRRNTSAERQCFDYILKKKEFSSSIGYVVLDRVDMDYLLSAYDLETVVSASRNVANILAEESGRMSLIVYPENTDHAELVQFRMRRSSTYKMFDLRRVLDLFSIKNGGGHEGAIGFRISRMEIGDIPSFVLSLITGIEKAIEKEKVS
jgi:nanoRNase/pAp phosphatase (c-di-AMP/oligoRNAs hydrolase)